MNHLPNFDAFIESLTKNDKDYIAGINDKEPETFIGDLSNHDDFVRFLSFMSEYQYQKTLRLLDVYTDWLRKHL